MTWFICIITQKPFLEWEIEKFLQVHPQTTKTIIKSSFYFSYDCRQEIQYSEKPTEENPNFRLVMGKGYISKTTGYAQADEADFEKLINFEFAPADIDGFYLAFKIRENFMQLTNDMYAHYPVYYINADDYIIVSNKQHFITQLIGKKHWNYSSISAFALLNLPLDRKAFIKNIATLPAGSVLTIRKNQIDVVTNNSNFLSDNDVDEQKYLFTLKKAYEMQINEKDFVNLPFEANFSSRFAFSVWCHKPKKLWGLYHLQTNEITPEKYIDISYLNMLNIKKIQDFTDSDELFELYKNYVLTTGLSDFPLLFPLSNFNCIDSNQINRPILSPMRQIKMNEINFLGEYSEWFFENQPLNRVEKIFKILRLNSFKDFKKNFVLENYFFRDEFYPFLLKGLKQHFDDFVQNMTLTDTIYDKYHFLINNYHINICAKNFAWLNDYKNFYCPGLLYSLTCKHLQQRYLNSSIIDKSQNFHMTLAEESLTFPKTKDTKYKDNIFNNTNNLFFHLMLEHISMMLEKAEKVPYYDFEKLLKMYKKALKGNENAVNIMIKWIAFEIWREFLE